MIRSIFLVCVLNLISLSHLFLDVVSPFCYVLYLIPLCSSSNSHSRPTMSAPAPSSYSRAIPIKDNSQNLSNLSQSLGGTIYGTTPGGNQFYLFLAMILGSSHAITAGTRIVYDRNALLLMRNSPLSKTPPVGILIT